METVLAEGKPLLSREQRRQVDEAIREQVGENPTIAVLRARGVHVSI